MAGDAECEFTSRPEYVDDITGSSDLIATRRNNEHRCDNCGSISSTKVELCDQTLGCKDVKQKWYPVYKMKGKSYRGQPSIGIGYRRYAQDPSY